MSVVKPQRLAFTELQTASTLKQAIDFTREQPSPPKDDTLFSIDSDNKPSNKIQAYLSKDLGKTHDSTMSEPKLVGRKR